MNGTQMQVRQSIAPDNQPIRARNCTAPCRLTHVPNAGFSVHPRPWASANLPDTPSANAIERWLSTCAILSRRCHPT
jgi:hypothetical protein